MVAILSRPQCVNLVPAGQLIKVKSCRYASAIKATMSSHDGMSVARCLAIICPSAALLLIRYSGMIFLEIWIKIHQFHSRKWIQNCHLQNDGHFVMAVMNWFIVAKRCLWYYGIIQVMACCLFGGNKPLPEPMMTYCQVPIWALGNKLL